MKKFEVELNDLSDDDDTLTAADHDADDDDILGFLHKKGEHNSDE